MSGEFLMGLPRLWRVANPVVASVIADFEYALTHAEAGDSDAVRLVDPVAPEPGWTTRQLRRAQTPTRAIAKGRDVRVCAAESRPAARADLTGSLMSRPRGKVDGPVAHAGPSAAETPRRSLTPDSVGGADRK
jgi:hypothetical protein